MVIIKKTIGEGRKKPEPFYSAVNDAGMENGAAALENSLTVPQIHSAILLLDICPREMKTYYPHKNLYVNVHSSIIHNSQKVETSPCLSNDEWINKMWNIRTTENYSVTKRNKVQIHATT